MLTPSLSPVWGPASHFSGNLRKVNCIFLLFRALGQKTMILKSKEI